MEWIHFVVGMLGALTTAYLAKNEAIPEFRLFSDTTSETMAEANRHHERSRKTAKEIDDIQEAVKNGTGNAEHLTIVLKSSQEELREERARLQELERRMWRDQFISRSMGFVFYVILGGAFGFLLTGFVKVDGVTEPLPKAVESFVIGASWTTYLTAIGLRTGERKANERGMETGRQAASEIIEAAKKEITDMVAQEVATAEKAEKVEKPVIADKVAGQVAGKLEMIASEIRQGGISARQRFKIRI